MILLKTQNNEEIHLCGGMFCWKKGDVFESRGRYKIFVHEHSTAVLGFRLWHSKTLPLFFCAANNFTTTGPFFLGVEPKNSSKKIEFFGILFIF